MISQLTSPVCNDPAKDRGIVVTYGEASKTATCRIGDIVHTDGFKGHNIPRSPTSSANSLGQSQATAKVCGSQIFQRVILRYLMRRHGHRVINYVDDYVGFGVLSDTRSSFDLLYDLLPKLDLTVRRSWFHLPLQLLA